MIDNVDHYHAAENVEYQPSPCLDIMGGSQRQFVHDLRLSGILTLNPVLRDATSLSLQHDGTDCSVSTSLLRSLVGGHAPVLRDGFVTRANRFRVFVGVEAHFIGWLRSGYEIF